MCVYFLSTEKTQLNSSNRGLPTPGFICCNSGALLDVRAWVDGPMGQVGGSKVGKWSGTPGRPGKDFRQEEAPRIMLGPHLRCPSFDFLPPEKKAFLVFNK